MDSNITRDINGCLHFFYVCVVQFRKGPCDGSIPHTGSATKYVYDLWFQKLNHELEQDKGRNPFRTKKKTLE
jgi:hypothetical protein